MPFDNIIKGLIGTLGGQDQQQDQQQSQQQGQGQPQDQPSPLDPYWKKLGQYLTQYPQEAEHHLTIAQKVEGKIPDALKHLAQGAAGAAAYVMHPLLKEIHDDPLRVQGYPVYANPGARKAFIEKILKFAKEIKSTYLPEIQAWADQALFDPKRLPEGEKWISHLHNEDKARWADAMAGKSSEPPPKVYEIKPGEANFNMEELEQFAKNMGRTQLGVGNFAFPITWLQKLVEQITPPQG